MARTPLPAGQTRALPKAPESERTGKRKCGLLSSVRLVEREIQLQNIDPRVTEDAEITATGVLLDELANFVLAQRTSFSNARDLELGIAQADLRIESATRRGNCIRWHRLGIAQAVFGAIYGNAILNRVF